MDDPIPASSDLRILAIDIGGSGFKAAVLDAEGNMLTDRMRVKTPHPCTPDALLAKLGELVEMLAGTEFNHISVGFPGVVRRGTILTAANLGAELQGFPLAEELSQRFGHPCRAINDADMQGLAAVHGHGVEVVITLGTGMGSAMFNEGQLAPHLELAHHPFRKGETYEEQIGNSALEKVGSKKWNRRVGLAITTLRNLTTFDRLFIGGGNARLVDFKLDHDVEIIDNTNGIKGGAWLWRQPVKPA